MRARFTVLCLIGTALMAQSVDRTKPPQTPPLPAFRLPPVSESQLDNGLAVALVEDPRFPLVTVRLSFQAGSKYDPANLPGLSQSVGAMLTEGTKARSARQIAEDLASIGGTLVASSSPDALTLAGSALSEHAGTLIDLVADVARNAAFPEEEVALHKQNRQQELLAQRSDPAYLADEAMHRVVFGSHPYGHIGPTAESIERLDRHALAAFRDRLLIPNNATLIVLGRLPERARMLALIGEKFGGWERRPAPEAPQARFPEQRKTLVLVDRPGSVQADIRVARRAVTRREADYFPLLLADNILGGGASSRMFRNIREEKGYAYDAHSELDARRDAGLFSAVTQVRNEVVEPALQAVFSELGRMAAQPVPAAELDDVKNYLTGHFVLGLESQDGLARMLNMVKVMGLPNDYLEKYTPRVRAVTPAQIQAAAERHMTPDKAAVIVVGDGAKIGKSLEKFGKFEVTKADQ